MQHTFHSVLKVVNNYVTYTWSVAMTARLRRTRVVLTLTSVALVLVVVLLSLRRRSSLLRSAVSPTSSSKSTCNYVCFGAPRAGNRLGNHLFYLAAVLYVASLTGRSPCIRTSPRSAAGQGVWPWHLTPGRRRSLSDSPVPPYAGLRLQSSGGDPRRRTVESAHSARWIIRQLEVRSSDRRQTSTVAQLPPETGPVRCPVPPHEHSTRLDRFLVRSGRSSRPTRRLPASAKDPERIHDGHSALSPASVGLLRRPVCADTIRRNQQRRSVVSEERQTVFLGPQQGEHYHLWGSFGGSRPRPSCQL